MILTHFQSKGQTNSCLGVPEVKQLSLRTQKYLPNQVSSPFFGGKNLEHHLFGVLNLIMVITVFSVMCHSL